MGWGAAAGEDKAEGDEVAGGREAAAAATPMLSRGEEESGGSFSELGGWLGYLSLLFLVSF